MSGFGLLKNKNILVTGSSRGIGKTLALKVAEEGANVCLHYQFSEKEATELADEIARRFKVRVIAVSADMQRQDQIQELFKVIGNEFRSLEGLVLNAASGNRKNLLDQTAEDWARISTINVLGPVQCVREGLELLKKGQGRVLMISSEGARFGIPHYGAIGVTKAALEATVRQLTTELRDTNITINGVSATLVRTAALEAVTRGETERYAEKYFISPEDVSWLCSWMLSDACPRSLRGQVVRLDNGTLSEFIPAMRGE